MQLDAFGLPLTTSSEEAAQAFDAAGECLLSGTGNPMQATGAVLELDPNLAIAHSADAMARLLGGDPLAAREAALRGVELAGTATRREQQHAAIFVDVVTGKRDPALAKIKQHIAEFPRDALALDPAAGVFGLIGFSGRQDREVEQLALLEPLADAYGDHWWYQHVFGFALLECDQAERAVPLVEAALDQVPDSGHVAHTWVHALFEDNQHDRALGWLEDWLPRYQPDGIMYCHLWWHLALFHLLNKDFDAMWQMFDEHCQAGVSASPPINLFTDGVALLWRAEMAGAGRSPERMNNLRALGEANFPKPGIFVDVHRAACLAYLGDQAALDDFRAQCGTAFDKGRLWAGEVVIQLTDGFAAYAGRDFARARELLTTALPQVVRIGGSRAQRRLVDETIAAAARALRSAE